MTVWAARGAALSPANGAVDAIREERGTDPGGRRRRGGSRFACGPKTGYDRLTRRSLLMRSVIMFRTGTAAAVVVWKLAALALLPVAFCCQAAMAVDHGVALACCEGDEHGAMCPMKRAGRDADPQDGRPRMVDCKSLDDALVGLLGLTGFTPDAFEGAAGLDPLERVAEVHPAAASLAGAPSLPPPRA